MTGMVDQLPEPDMASRSAPSDPAAVKSQHIFLSVFLSMYNTETYVSKLSLWITLTYDTSVSVKLIPISK